LNDPAHLLSIFLGGALGRSGRKHARKAARFVGGHRGFISASTLLAAAGVAWGIYDSMKGQQAAAPGAVGVSGPMGAVAASGTPTPPPLPVVPGASTASSVPDEVLRIVRLAVSAARADGSLTPHEREIILQKARESGVEPAVEAELAHPHSLADLVRGLDDPQKQKDLYVLAFTIVRADETVTGGERIYLAQLAHQLGLDAATVAVLEQTTSTQIDSTQP
jgi:uncharacterized membrane protein YebE (DUF533 family)